MIMKEKWTFVISIKTIDGGRTLGKRTGPILAEAWNRPSPGD
jgi:hypothetical protein